MFDWLFGSSESKTELPGWITGPASEMLQRSADLGKAGYMPWTGPSVAALDRAQISGMRNNAAMANAFGMDARMPEISASTGYGNGLRGHSAMPLYDQNMATLQERAPGQMDYYNSFFVDPVTGVEGSRMQPNQPNVTPGVDAGGGQMVWTMHPDKYGQDIWSDQAVQRRITGGSSAADKAQFASSQPMQGPQQPQQDFLGSLGITGIGDFFDGGGLGQSGTHHQGLLSGRQKGKVGDGLLGRIF